MASNSRRPVPELTRSAGIQLNGRVSLRCIPHALSIAAPDIAQRPRYTPGKAVSDHIPLGGFVFNPTIEPFGQHRDVHSSGTIMPAPQLKTAGEMLAVLCNQPTMSAQIIKVSVSLVAVATSAVSLFVISWIGLALLGF